MTDEPTTQAGRALETLGREYPWLRRRAVHIEEQAIQQLRDAAFDVLRLIETDSGWLPYSEAYLRLKDALGSRTMTDERLREALNAMVQKWGPHSGSCCVFDTAGKVIVTPESCKCGPVVREARAALRAALAATPETPTLDETILQEMVTRPLTSAYFEDYHAGRLDAEQVARALAGDYAEGVRIRARLSQPTATPEKPTLDVERLAEAWANVMDGRRLDAGLNAPRISRDTTSADDWQDISAEYARLSQPTQEPGAE